MYLVMVIYDNRVNHIMPFDPAVWSHPETAWQLACDYANQMCAKLGFDISHDRWTKDSNSNNFCCGRVCISIEKAYTPMRKEAEGAMAVAKAHTKAYRMREQRETFPVS